MRNLLLEKVDYKIEETPHGVWRRFVYPNGQYFAEFRSHTEMFGLPFVHFTRGICPETGRHVVARGVIGIGRIATGIIAIGQASAGLIAFGQASIGVILCLAQAGAGLYAVGQIALGGIFGAGQIATGVTAIGQIAAGRYVLAQMGFGTHVWTPGRANPVAVRHFQEIWNWISSYLPNGE
ncbi:MAG TPA: hypothetical protein VE398_00540 [Acidobacteriota bacterium]|nr:hypothetical protein [Acidobacteriota bacterium]